MRAQRLGRRVSEDVRVIRKLWTEEFTAEEHVALMRTASEHRLMEPAKARVVIRPDA